MHFIVSIIQFKNSFLLIYFIDNFNYNFLKINKILLKEDDIYLNIVMDFIPDTLAKIIKQFRVQKEIIPNIISKVFGY